MARRVVIVGGGFSGAAAAVHLLRRAPRGLEVVLIERRKTLGRGVAFDDSHAPLRLNTPASVMSLDPTVPDDFVSWASAERAPDAFLERSVFGRYVESRLADAIAASAGTLRTVRGEAVRASAGSVTLDDGTLHAGDAVVLATGHSPRPIPTDGPIVDAWDEGAMRGLPRKGSLLLVGTGLTSLDVLARLAAVDFSGHVTLLSRHGLLPRPHLTTRRPRVVVGMSLRSDLPRDLRSLVRWVRRVVETTVEEGEPWQSAIDAMRPLVSTLWRRLSARDRARFARTVRPYWEVLRHRAPPEALSAVEDWRREGRLSIVPGAIVASIATANRITVELQSPEGRRQEVYDSVIRCTGVALERPERASALLQDLIETGSAMADEAGLGIVTDEAGRVVQRTGDPDPALFAMGALRRASFWETTSVPEITAHAASMAKLIVPDG